MKVTYTQGGKYAEFDGTRYCRDDRTGYYLNATIRKRLHRAVWEYHNGEIPDGCHVHHVDGNKNNNEIENLELLNGHDHLKLHGDGWSVEHRERLADNLRTKAMPAAKAWHKSANGKAWHKEHYEQSCAVKMHAKRVLYCKRCGKEYIGGHNNVFCSKACKSAWRRAEGLDDVDIRCEVCGKGFRRNRYARTKCCSRSCANRYRNIVRKSSGDQKETS